MSKTDKILEKVLNGQSDASIHFADLTYLLQKLGAKVRRGDGSHVILILDGQLINLQSASGKAKAYQVAQVRSILKNRK